MSIVAKARAELSWLQAQDVPVGGHYDVYRDDRDGAVGFAQNVNPRPVDAWPDAEGKEGFGRGTFGGGRFGHGSVGLGFGGGVFGGGRFGFGGHRLACRSRRLADGTWTWAVVGVDAAGNPVAPAAGTEVSVALAGTPRAPSDPSADDYDAVNDVLTLGWNLSADDEAA